MTEHNFSRLSFRNVGVDFGKGSTIYQAVKDVSFDVKHGDVTCIIGPSGCGKSTMLNLIGGFIKPARGTIEVVESALSLNELRKAFIFQDYALFPWRTSIGNVKFGLEVLKLPKQQQKDRALGALRDVGLEDFANFYPHKLSGGMKQRVSVARALAFDPDILLMDEPFAALDEEMREELQDLVLKIWRQTRKTILYITHSIPEAVFLADRVIVFTPGPGEVRSVVDIDLPKPRDRLGSEFRDYERELVALVRRHRLASA
jgi:NitT/TauT family transport system ATP-binding protein